MEQAKQAVIPTERMHGEYWAFMSLKFHDGEEDKKKVEALTEALEKAGIRNVVMARDVEKWGQSEIPQGKKLMPDFAFPAMEKCDMMICEFSEKGVGLGIGTSYAYAKGKPVIIIAKTGSDISATIKSISSEIIFYDKPEDLVEPLKNVVNKLPRVILASQSQVRKEMMIDEGIPFEVIVSDADETPDARKSFRAQLAEIAMRNAKVVLDKTDYMGKRLIVAGDQNIVFDGQMYGKPKSIDDARKLIKRMEGREDIYAYTGNAIMIADGGKILESMNITDIARMSMDSISDEELENYLHSSSPLTHCGGFYIGDATFVRLKEGRYSTTCGMTIEFVREMYKGL